MEVLGHLADDAEMLVSELLTNALKASWSPQSASAGLIALRLLANHQRLLIEVWDQNPADPQPREASDDLESGRGFTVIEALSHRWGFTRVSVVQKVVWCEMVIGDQELQAGGDQRDASFEPVHTGQP